MERRALEEEDLMTAGGTKPVKELKAPRIRPKPPKSGRGFGGASANASPDADSIGARLATERAKIVARDGVLRVPNALSGPLADAFRAHVLEQQQLAATLVEQSGNDLAVSKSFYGVENSRQSRCDLQLSLLRGGYARDNEHGGSGSNSNSNDDDDTPHTVADVLYELLSTKDGTLRHLYEHLVTTKGEFYELAAVVTNPGSKRQQVHPDLPYQTKAAPLYVVFLALQDVTVDMGPTTFLLKTHNNRDVQTKSFMGSASTIESKNKVLQTADCRQSTLAKGDAVVFDARVLHCGNANNESTRVLFNFSFRNPEITGNLGYPGSIRPGYSQAMTLEDVTARVDAYGSSKHGSDSTSSGNDGTTATIRNVKEPFGEYGDGLLRY